MMSPGTAIGTTLASDLRFSVHSPLKSILSIALLVFAVDGCW